MLQTNAMHDGVLIEIMHVYALPLHAPTHPLSALTYSWHLRASRRSAFSCRVLVNWLRSSTGAAWGSAAAIQLHSNSCRVVKQSRCTAAKPPPACRSRGITATELVACNDARFTNRPLSPISEVQHALFENDRQNSRPS